jgi:sulfhydrogenase subunit beta (sulfur reductase)
VISRSQLAEFVEKACAAGYAVYAPLKKEGGVYLMEMGKGEKPAMDHVLTVNGVKDVLLPRCEGIADFRTDQVGISPLDESPGRRIIFGTRPCDAASLSILDAILLEPVCDTRYAKRRSETVIVTVACSRADSACFCTSMGGGPHNETGSDVILLPSGDSYLVRGLTEKGAALLDELEIEPDRGGEPDSPPVVMRTVKTDGLKQWLDGNFGSERWKDVSVNCISCGICYYLCPTCHCFDIVDGPGLSRARRYRIWDCCSFSDFTRMAGHQPRATRHARYRQRIMHKFKYTVDNQGVVACVGDGRCIRHCPAGVDMGEILEKLAGEPGRGRGASGEERG